MGKVQEGLAKRLIFTRQEMSRSSECMKCSECSYVKHLSRVQERHAVCPSRAVFHTRVQHNIVKGSARYLEINNFEIRRKISNIPRIVTGIFVY